MYPSFLLDIILSLALVNLSFGAPIPVRRHERHSYDRLSHDALERRLPGTVAKRDEFNNVRFTWYPTDTGADACTGKDHKDSDWYVALNIDQFGESGNGHCGEKITINYKGKTAVATIVDCCATCSQGQIDLTKGLFQYLDGNLDDGVFYGDWSFGDTTGGDGSPSKTGNDAATASKPATSASATKILAVNNHNSEDGDKSSTTGKKKHGSTSSAPAPSGSATPSGTGVPPASGSKSPTSGAPHFVIYSDEYNNGRPPPVEDIDGFNVVALSFLQTNGAQDQVQEWTQLDKATQKSILDQYHAKGIKLIISLFGAEDQPTSKGADPVAVAQQAAKFVKQYGLDGVDVDYEDMDAINKGDGKGEQWIIDLTKTLRQELPQGQYIISHAPVAPWFQPGAYKAGAYVKVNQEVGSMIDFYNIQYYNQGDSAYTTCDDLITKSNSFPGTSIMELSTSGGIPASKLVIGKPGNQKSASNGYMDPATIGKCAALATKQGWNGGIMTWEYPDANAAWIKAAKGNTFTRRGRSVLN